MNQEDMPLVTAVVPVYNHENYVIESIRSIVNQTYRNVELIVINDGSKDGSHERVLSLTEECKQRFVRFEYINRENIGLSATLNQALSMAKGKYFTALASDDIAFPEKVESLVNTLEAKGPSYAAAFGNAWFIDDKGEKIRLDNTGRISEDVRSCAYDNFIEFYAAERISNPTGEDFGTYRTLIEGNYLPAMSNVIRTAAISEAGGWTAGNLIEDWEMWLKLAKRYKLAYVDAPVAFYRWHAMNSVKVDGYAPALYSLLQVVDREEQYCQDNGIITLWNRSHNRFVYQLLRNKQFPSSKKLSLLKTTNKRSLLIFIIGVVARRFTRSFRNLCPNCR
jgi:alpha-1,3-rhamnosyltransferase